ncbi:alpha/beta fold hydrolase [Oceanicola sp. 502str15]|uniref:alpha/beta fold hydrolase n=1 Tax=Oceanicola sp. 502str15 TaxID=2696061 RepID=UPI0020951688|nr:alpha/beta hydrolase [Oceanicola sp. 502str15]MCO6382255.1 alpha/beta fold hydrolase [Oceanicola sp. 502str15]
MTLTAHSAHIDGLTIAYEVGGAPTGLPLLFLHGFPQTRAMWHPIAPAFAASHPIVLADLPGYGDSDKPESLKPYAFREMARRLAALMSDLGHETFAVISHDRGARVAHRMALDHPERLAAVTLMDIIPTHTLLTELQLPVAKSYYHWFFLAQPAPFPESLIAPDPNAFYESCLLGWGSAKITDFHEAQLAAYRKAWANPDTRRAMCNDYRTALTLDLADDTADLGAKIQCPAQILYGASGAMAQLYDVPATWAPKTTQQTHAALPGGHFFPDTAPAETTEAVKTFLATL